MTFTVHCTGCDAAFPIDSAKVPHPGVYAECSECATVFLVRPQTDAEPPAAASTGTAAAPAAEVPPPVVDTAVAVEEPPAPQPPEPAFEPPAFEAPAFEPADPVEAPAATAHHEPAVATPAAPAATPEPAPQPVSPFGRRDPHERARRLARVLVSDMIAYYPDRHRQSLQAGTLARDFEEEIEKSWSEYVDQVGKDMADSTTYFKDALNDVLAEGREVF